MGGGDITVDATAMFGSRANVPAISSTGRPCSLFVCFLMDEQASSKWGQRVSVLIKCTMKSRASRIFFIVSAVAKEIQGKLNLWQKTIPFFGREIGISTVEA